MSPAQKSRASRALDSRFLHASVAFIHVYIENKSFLERTQDSDQLNLMPRLNNKSRARALAMLL